MSCRELLPTRKSKCFRYFVVGIAMVVVVVSVLVAIWMTNIRDEATWLKPNISCVFGQKNCVGSVRHCGVRNASAFLKEIDLFYSRRIMDLKENVLEKTEDAYLASATYAFYRPPRDLVHWIIMDSCRANETAWVNVKHYEMHRSTYTVSAGVPGCYQNGSLIIKRGGLYKVYSKLTFACAGADRKKKRVSMELSRHELSHTTPVVILRDVEESICAIKGDLTTLYLEGTFRFRVGDRLQLRFKASDGVTLSNDRNRGYKSNIGLYGISL